MQYVSSISIEWVLFVIIDIKVVPGSGKQGFKRDKADRIVCYLKSLPERGLANHELITQLSKALKTPQSKIAIVFGLTSRNKRVSIDTNLPFPDILKLLGIEPQLSLLQ